MEQFTTKNQEKFYMNQKNLSKIKIRSLYDDSRVVVQLNCKDLSRTLQSQKDDANINNILKKYAKTGVLPSLIKQDPKYGDFSEGINYHDAMNVVLFAQEQFAGLSADVRKRFGNDPQLFMEFCNDPKNAEEMVSLGLAERTPESKVDDKNASLKDDANSQK